MRKYIRNHTCVLSNRNHSKYFVIFSLRLRNAVIFIGSTNAYIHYIFLPQYQNKKKERKKRILNSNQTDILLILIIRIKKSGFDVGIFFIIVPVEFYNNSSTVCA